MSELGDQLLAVHDGLDAAGIPHAIGGAIALGYCVLEPRGTLVRRQRSDPLDPQDGRR